MATQPPQSLPSFAQAFGAPSLSRISDANNALPPIHPRASPLDPSSSAHDDLSHHMRDPPRQSSRKRAHPDASAHPDDNLSSGSDERRSPKSVRIKEETEYDVLPSPTSRAPPTPAHGDREPPHASQQEPDAASAAAMATAAATSPAPAPSASRPSPNKKRRVTISGISHPINTDVRPPPSTSTDPNTSQAISPVVMGLPIPRDDAAALEQMRSMLTIKQQQKELIESRRGSTAGIVPAGSPSVSVNVVNASPAAADDRQPPSNKSHVPQPRASTGGTGNGGRSPITAAPPRRSVVGLSANVPPNRALSPLVQHASPPPPHPHIHSQHGPSSSQMLHPPPPPGEQQHPAGSHHALPQPASSFARRRATRQLGSAGGPGSKGKPADIMISPRDALGALQPSIQSAPPIPRAATIAGQGMTGRFGSMALPSLPPVLGPGQSAQRMTASRVPPTPTRLSMARNPAGTSTSILTPTVGSISGAASGRSPPTASVPIATTLVPPTPAALQANGYTGEKGAFLAPFAQFYDALADSRTLKQWLAEQLQKSQALATQLQRQQEHLDELVAAAVERKLGGVREEMGALQRRVDELEIALHHASGSGAGPAATTGLGRTSSSGPGQAYSLSPNMGTVSLTGKGKAKVNGIPPSYQQHPHALAHPHTPSHLPPHPYPPPHHPSSGGVVPESYQFPPHPDSAMRRPEPVRRALSPTSLERERDGAGSGQQGSGVGNESRSFPGSQTGSPVPFDVGRRLSVSAIRLDPRSPATPSGEPPLHPSAHAHSQAHAHPSAHTHAHSHRPSVVSLSGREREREREREGGSRPGTLPPPPSAAPGGPSRTSGDNAGWSRTWSSPRAPRASLPSSTSGGAPNMTSATRSSLSQTTGAAAGLDRDRDRDRDREREHDRERERERERERGERPGLARRSSAQRVAGEGYAYALPEGGAGERERAEKENLREKESLREMDVSPPPRDVRSPEPMEE
ncbi:hypothetical protein C8Q70DRAFT_1051735 [Cubamyces menziesii]|nr:hypothetical protein C8Q70DRAFT_1051735 [Cubamyces menziesii]